MSDKSMDALSGSGGVRPPQRISHAGVPMPLVNLANNVSHAAGPPFNNIGSTFPPPQAGRIPFPPNHVVVTPLDPGPPPSDMDIEFEEEGGGFQEMRPEDVRYGIEGGGELRDLGVDASFKQLQARNFNTILRMFDRNCRNRVPEFEGFNGTLTFSFNGKNWSFRKADGTMVRGNFCTWEPEGERNMIFGMLDQMAGKSVNLGHASGATTDVSPGYRSLRMTNPSCLHYDTSLAPNRDLDTLEKDLRTKTKNALDEGYDGGTITDFDPDIFEDNIDVIFNNYDAIKTRVEDQIDALASNTDNASKERVKKLRLFHAQLERMDLFAVSVAAGVKKHRGDATPQEQMVAARELAETIFHQHKKIKEEERWQGSLWDKARQLGSDVLSGVKSDNAEAFKYASQVAAMTIDDPVTRNQFLEEQLGVDLNINLEGGNGLTLRQVIADDRKKKEEGITGGHLRVFEKSDEEKAEEKKAIEDEVQRHAKQGWDYRDTLAERLFLEPNLGTAERRVETVLNDCGIHNPDDRGEILDVFAGEWEEPPLNS